MGGAILRRDDGLMFLDGEGVVPCCRCGAPAEHECDFIVGQGKSCDLPLCGEHAIRQSGEDVDFCPSHHAVAHGPAEPAECRTTHAEHARRVVIANEQFARRADDHLRRKGRLPDGWDSDAVWMEEFERAGMIRMAACGSCPSCQSTADLRS